MEERLELNEVTELKQGEKLLILDLTTIQLHTNARIAKSMGGVIERSVESKEEGRIFSPIDIKKGDVLNDSTLRVSLPFNIDDPSLKETVKKYQKQGYRVMIRKPKGGLPVCLGNDAKEFIDSKNGKRIIRGLAKKKKQE